MPAFFFIAVALLCVIWGFLFIRRHGLLGGCFVAVVTGSCFGHSFFHVGPLTIDRLMIVALAACYFCQRSLFHLPAKRLNRTDVAILLFLIGLVLNTFAHTWQVDGAQPVATLLFFYLLPFVFYWVASRCAFGEQEFRWLLTALSCFGAYLSLTALCEVVGMSATVFPRYIASPEHTEFLGRARGPFLNPVGNGLYMTTCLVATIFLWPYARRAHRPLLVGIAFLIVLGQIATMTRSVWLGLAVSSAAMCVLAVAPQHRLRIALAFVLLGAIAFTATSDQLARFKRDKHVTAAEMEQSAKLRPILAAYAFELFRDHPLSGVGFGQYSHRNVDYLTARTFDVPLEKATSYVQHNVFLSLLAETGLVGLLSFIVLLGFWTIDGWKTWAADHLALWQRQIGLLAIVFLLAYCVNAMFHDLSLIPMVNAMVFLLAGLLRNQQEARQSVPRGVRASDVSPLRTSGWSLG